MRTRRRKRRRKGREEEDDYDVSGKRSMKKGGGNWEPKRKGDRGREKRRTREGQTTANDKTRSTLAGIGRGSGKSRWSGRKS